MRTTRNGTLIESLIGQRFGMLTVIKDTPEVKVKGCRTVYCQCDCGGSRYVPPYMLLNGKAKDCGDHRKTIDPQTMVGQRYGKLVVLAVSDKLDTSGHRCLYCQCDCGNTCYKPAFRLRSGEAKGCGCSRVRDITGQRFGMLTAIEPVEKLTKYGGRIWRCACDCGSECEIAYAQLMDGRRRSCGCMPHGWTAKNVAGQRFGKLTAIEPVGKVKDTYKWRCVCDCGRETEVLINNLTSGHTKSCGCGRKKEQRVED